MRTVSPAGALAVIGSLHPMPGSMEVERSKAIIIAQNRRYNLAMVTMTADLAKGKTSVEPPQRSLDLRVVTFGPHDQPDGFQALAAEWDTLVDTSAARPFFMRLAWQTVWWENLGLGERWITAYYRPDTGELVGILPLYLLSGADSHHEGRPQLSIVGCIEVSDYLDVIVATGWESAVYAAFLGWLYSDAAPAWEVVDLCNLPSVSTTYVWLPEMARARGATVKVFQEDVAPAIALPARYARYLDEKVEKKQRHEIRRKQRRIEREAEVGLYIVGPEHDLDREISRFIRLQRASRDDKAEFMNAEMQTFFRNMGKVMFQAGLLRLMFLTLNEEPAAALFAFSYDRRLLLYNSGYDPQLHAQLSPGWVILSYAIQYAIASGHQVLDFMQGDEEYKFRFGSVDYPVMRVLLER